MITSEKVILHVHGVDSGRRFNAKFSLEGFALPNTPERNLHLIPCDRDCFHQQNGYCALEEITYITDCIQNGCGYFSPTDPYSTDHIDRI